MYDYVLRVTKWSKKSNLKTKTINNNFKEFNLLSELKILIDEWRRWDSATRLTLNFFVWPNYKRKVAQAKKVAQNKKSSPIT